MKKAKKGAAFARSSDLTFIPTENLLQEITSRSMTAIGIVIVNRDGDLSPYIINHAQSWELSGLMDILEDNLMHQSAPDNGGTKSGK